MTLLALLSFILAIALLYLLITQVVLPALFNTTLFPVFRKNKLASEVMKTKGEVEDLEEYVDDLGNLVVLTKKKTRLEQELNVAAGKLKTASEPEVVGLPTTDVKS